MQEDGFDIMLYLMLGRVVTEAEQLEGREESGTEVQKWQQYGGLNL